MIFENRVEAIIDRISQQEGKCRETILLETMEMLELRGRYFFKISEISGRSVKDIFTKLMDNLDAIIAESNLVDGQSGLREVIAEKVRQRKTVIDQLAHILSKVEVIQASIHEHFSILDSAAIEIRKQVNGSIDLRQPSNLRKLRFVQGYFTSCGRIKPGTAVETPELPEKEPLEE